MVLETNLCNLMQWTDQIRRKVYYKLTFVGLNTQVIGRFAQLKIGLLLIAHGWVSTKTLKQVIYG